MTIKQMLKDTFLFLVLITAVGSLGWYFFIKPIEDNTNLLAELRSVRHSAEKERAGRLDAEQALDRTRRKCVELELLVVVREQERDAALKTAYGVKDGERIPPE